MKSFNRITEKFAPQQIKMEFIEHFVDYLQVIVKEEGNRPKYSKSQKKPRLVWF